VGAGYKWVRATSGCGYNWAAANLVRLQLGASTTGYTVSRLASQYLPHREKKYKERQREIEKRRQRSLCWLKVEGFGGGGGLTRFQPQKNAAYCSILFLTYSEDS
jgi:hypothetical protein